MKSATRDVDRRRRGAASVLVFIAGIALGLAVPVPLEPMPVQQATRSASAWTPRAERVRGLEPVDMDEELRATARRVATVQPPAARPPAPERELEHEQPVTAADIARNALDFTVFISAPGVYGAGILLDGTGHVLTCLHVIEGAQQIGVSLSSGARFDATVLDSDAELDLALLKIEAAPPHAITPASITGVEAGEEVFAMGAPRKMKFSLSRGMASFVGRRFEGAYYLQTDLALNGGNSGGPVMNAGGKVVAISSFVLKDSEGLSFALPIDYAYRRFGSWLQGTPAPEDVANDAFEGWLSRMDMAHSGD